jgi:RNA polymerase sigma-70 factor (ECF subfamily)
MSEPTLDTTDLRLLVERSRKGDREAQDALLRRAGQQLEGMARAMLRRFPAVHRQVETADVLQNALIRLLRALRKVDPGSTREFFALAAVQIRRELIDLARHLKHRPVLRQHPPAGGRPEGAFDAADEAGGETDMDFWCSLHEAVERLPVAEREVFSLSFYHGWTQPQIAELLHVTDRQVRRRWNAAVLALSKELGDAFPGVLREDGEAPAPA